MQRLVSSIAGDTWALLPHTAGFIDPFYSTGIAHSLLGVERLARIIPREHSDRQPALAGYQHAVTREIQRIDQLVSLAYTTMGRDPQLLHAASVLYFAAATTFEGRRRARQASEFLIADDTNFVRTVNELVGAFPGAGDSCESVHTFAQRVESQIAPWNSVGLFQPRHQNMYWQTAVEKCDSDSQHLL